MNLTLVAYTARTLAEYRGTHPEACEAEARLMLHAVEQFEQRRARRELGEVRRSAFGQVHRDQHELARVPVG